LPAPALPAKARPFVTTRRQSLVREWNGLQAARGVQRSAPSQISRPT
jgi:hypothetical protein